MSQDKSKPSAPLFPLANQAAKSNPMAPTGARQPNPNAAQAQAAFRTGHLKVSQGKFKEAVDAYQTAARLMPKEIGIWTAYSKALSMLGDKTANKRAQKVLKKSGLSAAAQKSILAEMSRSNTKTSRKSTGISKDVINQLLTRFNAGDAQAVATEAKALADAHKSNEIIRLILGASLGALGQNDAAEAAYREALAIAPDYAEARANLGELLTALGRYNDALEHLQAAYHQIPSNPKVLGNLGRAMKEVSRPHEALDYLTKFLKISPNAPLAQLYRAECLITLERGEEALKQLDALPEKQRANAETLALRAVALDQLGQKDDALAQVRAAFEIAPTQIRVVTVAGNLLQQHGAFDEAETILTTALDKGLKHGAIYRQIANGRKLTKDEPIALEMMETWADTPDLPSRADLGYALVKLMEDTKQYDKVWPYLEEANAVVRAEFPNPKGRDRGEFTKMMSFIEGMDFSRIGKVGYQGDSPIFVTGLPRSGTTLVEQILSSHSRVTGGDEMALFHTMGFNRASDVLAKGGKINDMTPKMLEDIGQEYREAVLKRHPGADIVTDKSISTYKVAPLVWLALPKAKIVALKRDPRDNLFSMLKNKFISGLHTYTYSQSELVEVYELFTEYLAAWRERAADRIYEIQYEELVANPEEEVRKLLAFCELDWEDACMNFHQNTRKVKTLSIHQARQPLYNSSIGRWRRYEDHLGEMLEGLKGMDGVPED